MEGNYSRSRGMEGYGVGGKSSNRVINASEEEEVGNSYSFKLNIRYVVFNVSYVKFEIINLYNLY
jgi:hypothetical protein